MEDGCPFNILELNSFGISLFFKTLVNFSFWNSLYLEPPFKWQFDKFLCFSIKSC